MKLSKPSKIILGIATGLTVLAVILAGILAEGTPPEPTPPPTPTSEYAHTGDGSPTPGAVVAMPTDKPTETEEKPADLVLEIGAEATPGNANPDSITLNKTELALTKGNTYKFRVSFAPGDAKRDILWSSSNKAVAAFLGDGTLTGVAAGTAVITAKTPNGKTARCAVTVKNPAIP